MSGRKQRTSSNKSGIDRQNRPQTNVLAEKQGKQVENREVLSIVKAVQDDVPSPANILIEDMTSRERSRDLYSCHTMHEKVLKDAAQMQYYRYAIYDNRHLFRNKVSAFCGQSAIVLGIEFYLIRLISISGGTGRQLWPWHFVAVCCPGGSQTSVCHRPFEHRTAHPASGERQQI